MFFEVTFLIEKIIFFILVFFCDLENTYTFIKTSSERWIAPATPPSRPCVVYFPILKQIDVDLAESPDLARLQDSCQPGTNGTHAGIRLEKMGHGPRTW